MTTYLADPDVTILHGDAIEQLATLPDGSVDCCVTSPPYWGLRDYGTALWDGGDAGCDHLRPRLGGVKASTLNAKRDADGYLSEDGKSQPNRQQYGGVCGKCGARRVDRQLGLEPTPDEYIAGMVAVFREVRRVLKDSGTLWLNIGDSYATGGSGGLSVTETDRVAAARRKVGYQAEGRSTGQHGGWENRASQGKGTAVAGVKPKDLVGIPWMLAFALRADGWYLRSDIIWAKPNPMPESVTDRPTKSHEYVFLLSKSPRYFFDQEAVRERLDHPHRSGTNPSLAMHTQPGNTFQIRAGERNGIDSNPAGRNVRSVWEIATQPYPEAHFATYPEELVRRCILAGTSERGVCPVCGKPWERQTRVDQVPDKGGGSVADRQFAADPRDSGVVRGWGQQRTRREVETLGWRPTCACIGITDWPEDADMEFTPHPAPIPATVLDPFMGSGTTAHVARKHGRKAIGIELNETYCELASRRLAQQSLLAL